MNFLFSKLVVLKRYWLLYLAHNYLSFIVSDHIEAVIFTICDLRMLRKQNFQILGKHTKTLLDSVVTRFANFCRRILFSIIDVYLHNFFLTSILVPRFLFVEFWTHIAPGCFLSLIFHKVFHAVLDLFAQRIDKTFKITEKTTSTNYSNLK